MKKLVVVELPYLLTEAIMFTAITYSMVGYYSSAYKVYWYCYTMFCSLMYFNFMGMMLVSRKSIGSVKRVPGWWIWLYYLCPTSWTLYGMLFSQYGDIETPIDVFGQTNAVAGLLSDYFGFHRNKLAIFMRKLNFQKR